MIKFVFNGRQGADLIVQAWVNPLNLDLHDAVFARVLRIGASFDNLHSPALTFEVQVSLVHDSDAAIALVLGDQGCLIRGQSPRLSVVSKDEEHEFRGTVLD